LIAGRVLLLGASGQLGTELARAFRDADIVAPGRRDADFAHPESLRSIVREAQPGLILNAAAYTAVDKAESEPQLADAVNHRGPRVLAEEADRAGALLLHYSTDYVFDGSKREPWVETDATAPLNVYGATKAAGEQAIAAACRHHVILRTSWLYAAHGHNFLRTMLRLGAERSVLRVVNDQWGAPTSASALADATRALVDRIEQGAAAGAEAWAGVYHATCGGSTTWHGFAEAIFASANLRDPGAAWAKLEGISCEQYPTPARRPRNSVLANEKLRQRFGMQLPEWKNALRGVLLD
jgi:dTDP-4-dehydrorhamnose reductase